MKQRRILIAEDDADSAALIAKWLLFDGHTVLSVTTGTEALAMAEGFNPDVAIIDIGLPDRDGLDVIRQLRGAHRGLLILCTTGRGQFEDIAQSREAGSDYHLVKPLDLTGVTAIIREWRPNASPAA